MPGQWYGRVTDLNHMPRPTLPSPWDEVHSQYVQNNPGDFNAWYLQQPGYRSSDLTDKFYGFLNTWLGGAPGRFGGYKVANPEARYEDYLLAQNPWPDYVQQNRPRVNAATFFGPRLQQR
jgi:hypothetical protein